MHTHPRPKSLAASGFLFLALPAPSLAACAELLRRESGCWMSSFCPIAHIVYFLFLFFHFWPWPHVVFSCAVGSGCRMSSFYTLFVLLTHIIFVFNTHYL
jgi:hypothetical protein